jgi:hypothetical protein
MQFFEGARMQFFEGARMQLENCSKLIIIDTKILPNFQLQNIESIRYCIMKIVQLMHIQHMAYPIRIIKVLA